MNRELRMVIVADTNTEESRQVIANLSHNPSIPQTVVTPELVKRIIPIRANPAIGVMFWSSDLQGMVADVEKFAEFIKHEDEIKQAAHTTQKHLSDEETLQQPKILFRTWEEVLAAGEPLEYRDKIIKDDQIYNVEQPNGVTPLESQAPDMEGMLAVYRPISPSHLGTIEDPIPWVSGMNCFADFYYTYNDKLYKVAEGGSMIPCTWAPDSGIWQWELVEEQ